MINFNDFTGEDINIKNMLKDRIGKGKQLEQFEQCSKQSCKYHNEVGTCSYETCRIATDDALTASMVVKTCQFCGNKFSTCLTNMPIQICPACRKAAYEARKPRHNCLFCGREIMDNPAIFFPCCDSCLDKLKIICHGSESSLDRSCNNAHCYDCEV